MSAGPSARVAPAGAPSSRRRPSPSYTTSLACRPRPGGPAIRASRYAASRCPCSAAARIQRSAPTSPRCSRRSASAYAPRAWPCSADWRSQYSAAGSSPALAVVAAQRVRGGGGSGDGGDPPPAGRLVGVAALVQEDTQVVGGGPVAGRGGGAQLGLGPVEVTAAEQHGSENAHRLDVAGLGGDAVDASLLGGLRRSRRRSVRVSGLHKPPCLQQSCLVPHNVHRRTTCNPGTPGIPQPVRSLQRFVDMPTERQVKHRSLNSPRRHSRPASAHHVSRTRRQARILKDPDPWRIRALRLQ